MALSLLGSLPSRQSDAEIDAKGYDIALYGVTAYALRTATEVILRGALDHVFFPSPVELKRECDKAQAPINRMRENAEHKRRAAEDRRREAEIERQRTPEARTKVQELTEQFHRSVEANAEPPVEFDWGPVHKRFDKQAVSVTDRKMRQG